MSSTTNFTLRSVPPLLDVLDIDKNLASYSHKCSNDADRSDHVEDCDDPEKHKHTNCSILFIRFHLERLFLQWIGYRKDDMVVI